MCGWLEQFFVKLEFLVKECSLNILQEKAPLHISSIYLHFQNV